MIVVFPDHTHLLFLYVDDAKFGIILPLISTAMTP